MTTVDLIRIFAEQAQAEANEAADARRLSKARLTLRKRLDDEELGENEDERS